MGASLSLYFQTIYNPRKSFQELAAGNDLYKISFKFILVPIVGYTLMYVLLTIAGGAPSALTPWLNIPKDRLFNQPIFVGSEYDYLLVYRCFFYQGCRQISRRLGKFWANTFNNIFKY